MFSFLQPILPQGSTWVVVVVKVAVRASFLVLGLAMIIPSFMASDSGTPEAIFGSYVLVTASLLVVLASILGNIGLGGLALLTFVVGFTPGPLVIKRGYLIVVLPATIALIADQWGFINLLRLLGHGRESSMDDATQVSGERLLPESLSQAPPVDIL